MASEIGKHQWEKGLVELEKQNLLRDDRMEELKFCDYCVLGKSHILKFETSKHVSSRPFKYAHAYLWYSTRAQTDARGSYFLTIQGGCRSIS